jgi:hypothetical protein
MIMVMMFRHFDIPFVSNVRRYLRLGLGRVFGKARPFAAVKTALLLSSFCCPLVVASVGEAVFPGF